MRASGILSHRDTERAPGRAHPNTRQLRWTTDQARCSRTVTGAIALGPAPWAMPSSSLDARRK